MRKYIKKAAVVTAHRVTNDMQITLDERTLYAKPGDYVVTGDEGTVVMGPDEFEATYEPVEDCKGGGVCEGKRLFDFLTEARRVGKEIIEKVGMINHASAEILYYENEKGKSSRDRIRLRLQRINSCFLEIEHMARRENGG